MDNFVKMHKNRKKQPELLLRGKKVIHIKKCGFIVLIYLYTKLYTLSTDDKMWKNMVCNRKNQTIVL